MAAVITYTLLILQLFCHLIATEDSNIGATTPPDATVDPSPTRSVLFTSSQVDVAYKVHHQNLTWEEAQDVCVQEGGYLADIDSLEKIEIVNRLENGTLHFQTYTGIQRVNDTWLSANTGLAVAELPWDEDEPWGVGNCAVMKDYAEGKLGQFQCDDKRHYVCEIPNNSINVTKSLEP